MIKTFPEDEDTRDALVNVSKPGMAWETIDLREIYGCVRRELALRERVYPKWVAKGSMSQAKADKELELMRQTVEFIMHCVWKAVITRREPTISRSELKREEP